jgi:NAD(P)-dependent dehydrogenase (short-subunit alcohol dehydrogenase family)
VCLVTGASNKRGLSCGIALRMAQEGADVVVSDIPRPPESFAPWDRAEGWLGLDSLVKKIEAMGRRSMAINADVTNSSQISDMVEKVVERFGRIDILVNNAALIHKDMGTVPVADVDEGVWNKFVAVNLTGVFLMCKFVVRQMIKDGQGGKIINISSISGKRGVAGKAPYCATKFGVIGLTQTLALEVAQYKINVNAVCPGNFLSWGSLGQPIFDAMQEGMSEKEAVAKVYADRAGQTPLGRHGTVEEVVNLVTFLGSSDSDYMTGQSINVDGGRVMVH